MTSTKRQIILAALVVALGAVVYLTWAFSDAPTVDETNAADGSQSLSEVLNAGVTSIDGEQTMLTATAEQYFATARLSRQTTRDEAVQTLQQTIDSAEDENVRMTAAMTVLKLAENIEAEGKIENLVLAKGFADCMAYISDGTVSVVVAVGGDGLTAAQAAQVHEIALSETGADVESIRVIEMK